VLQAGPELRNLTSEACAVSFNTKMSFAIHHHGHHHHHAHSAVAATGVKA